jgi:hypothetical protein
MGGWVPRGYRRVDAVGDGESGIGGGSAWDTNREAGGRDGGDWAPYVRAWAGPFPRARARCVAVVAVAREGEEVLSP